MKKTSLVHKDIGPHKHDIIIFDSYEMYAFCTKCGMHDWSVPEGYQGDGNGIFLHFLAKYPNAKKMDLDGNITEIWI